ncbi:lipocalin-like domain-containing protein [Burkholderia seminalis]|uniref:lipocalin-like domain-containing protein n=1 Tax=Burkholderia seminalis TaxID=488731 RepID=UPI00069CDBB3|nr:lipocalin-like domain-containing protein [Burkholderia seminalis]
MQTRTLLNAFLTGTLCVHAVLGASVAQAAGPMIDPSLVGTWTLVAADVVHADGTRGHDYGPAPAGLLMIDRDGHYTLQIYQGDRPRFASGDKATGTPDEFKAAVLGTSAHFGMAKADTAAGTLTFAIKRSLYPNWEGEQQVRHYELKNDELSYRVPPRPNGDVPVSVWKRVPKM